MSQRRPPKRPRGSSNTRGKFPPNRRGEAVPPISLAELKECMRVEDVAMLLGNVSRETIHRSIRNGLVTKSHEVLATRILDDLKQGIIPEGVKLSVYGKRLAASQDAPPATKSEVRDVADKRASKLPASLFATYMVRVPTAERQEFERAITLFNGHIIKAAV